MKERSLAPRGSRREVGQAIDDFLTGLAFFLHGALEALATLLGVYAGYPRASNGLMVVREELAKLEEQ
jgi:hypothetical protein